MTDRHAQTDAKQLVTHLKELTVALTAVHSDLYWLAMQTPPAADKPADQAADLNVSLLTDLKGAVDDMRLLLWQYIETASELDPQRLKEGLETQRLHRVTRFLQLLRKRLVAPVSEEEPVSFIERISAAVKDRLGDKAA